jgi:hypothetical protein
VFARGPAILDQAAQLHAPAWADVPAGQLLACHPAALDTLGEFDLFGGGQQRDPADLF